MINSRQKGYGKKKKEGILSAAAVCAMILLVVIAICFSVRYVQSTRIRVRNTTISTIRELTKGKADFLDERIRNELDDIKLLASFLSNVEAKEEAAQILQEYKKGHEDSNVLVLGKDLEGVASDGSSYIVQEDKSEYFMPALEGKTMMSDVYLGDLGRPYVLFQTPVYSDGQIVGGVYLQEKAETLKEAFNKSVYDNDGYSYVLRNNGDVMLAPISYGYAQFFGNLSIYDVLKKDENSEEIIRQFVDSLDSGRGGYAIFKLEGEQQVLYFQPLSEKNDWCFVSVIPLSLVEGDGRRIVESSFYMAVSIISFTAVAILLIGFLLFYINRKRRENDSFLLHIYEAISENIDTVIFILDGKTSEIDYVFNNSKKILGFYGQEIQQLRANGGREDSFPLKINEVLMKERPSGRETKELHIFNEIMGKDMWLSVAVYPFSLNNSQKYMFAVTDVTKEHQAIENLNAAVISAQKANQAKSSFLSNMSHDMRTPMNAIVGMTDIAKMHMDDRGRVEDCLNKISSSSNHLLELINDVLDMSKIESGKLSIEEQGFSLKELLRDVDGIVRPQCESRRQKFTMEIGEVIHDDLKGDALRLRQLLLNLLSNAVKYTTEGGNVVLSVKEQPAQHEDFAAFEFQVQDTGIGISRGFMKHLFEPFEREQDSRVSRIQGTGLGLVITKSIVDAMGGQIEVESEEGKGSIFTVSIGFRLFSGGTKREVSVDEEMKLRTDINLEDIDLSGKHILLVEDNELNQEIGLELLAMTGAKTDAAGNGKEGLEKFIQSECGYYDIILMDIQMPVMNGYEATREIRSLERADARTVKIVAMTANVFAEDVREAKKAGMDDYLAKPIDLKKLKAVLLKSIDSGKEK